MCGHGSLQDKNGNNIDPEKIRSQGQGLKVVQSGGWVIKQGTTKDYLAWAKSQKSLIEEMIENL